MCLEFDNYALTMCAYLVYNEGERERMSVCVSRGVHIHSACLLATVHCIIHTQQNSTEWYPHASRQ